MTHTVTIGALLVLTFRKINFVIFSSSKNRTTATKKQGATLTA